MKNTTRQSTKTELGDFGALRVYASPLPFNDKQVKVSVPEGSTLYEIVNQIVPNGYNGAVGAVVMINGDIIPFQNWKRVRPKIGSVVNVRVIPAGGRGGFLGTILGIAVSIVAPYLASAAIGATLASTVAFGSITYGQLLAGAISIVGKLAISALAPPPKQSGGVNNPAESPTQFIEGARNQISPYGVVPICLGTNRIVPYQAALPYTEVVNGENYARQLFTWGYGQKILVSDIRIGETPIENFEGVDIEHRLNGDLHLPTALFSNSVNQEELNVLLENANGFTQRLTTNDADEVIIDVTFNGLAAFDDRGNRGAMAVELDYQWADASVSPLVWQSGINFYTYSGNVYNASSFTVIEKWNSKNSQRFGHAQIVVYLNPHTGQYSYIDETDTEPALARLIRQRNEANAFPICSFRVNSVNGVKTFSNLIDNRPSNLFGTRFEDIFSFVPTLTSSTVITISGGKIKFPVSVIGYQTEALRYSHRIVFPSRGQYAVRVRRVTPDYNSDKIIDKVNLTAIKSVTYQAPVSQTGICGTATRIKATNQLNGAIDQLNALVSQVIPDYNPLTGTWTDAISSNCSAVYRYVLQCPANARALSDSEIDIEKLEEWWELCNQKGYTYNRVIDYEASLDDVLRDIASAGAASPAIVDGKRSVVIDNVKNDIVQIITPRNSWDYEGEMIYTELPHAIRAQFRNRDKDYQQDELIVYDDGFDANNATIFETMELLACDNSDLAFKTVRRHFAAIKLRPETHSWSMDFENLVAKRGDRVKFVSDIALIGVGDGRIKSVTMSGGSPNLVTGFTIDDVVTIPAAGTYYTRIRLADGTQLYKQVNVSIGENTSFNFTVPFNDAIPAIGDLCYFVEAGEEKDLIITRIEPAEDLTARIYGIDYNEAIFEAESAPIPPFESKLSVPAEFRLPNAPLLLSVQSDESVMQVNSDGSLLTRMVITLENTNDGNIIPVVSIRETGATLFRPATILESTPERVVISGLQDGTRYDVHIRYSRIGTSLVSIPLQLNNYEFVGASGTPSDVTGFKIAVLDGSALLTWDAVDDIDLSHYALRFSGVTTGATWGSALSLEPIVYENRLTVPFQSGTYLIKAIDRQGNESANATAIVTFDQGALRNVVEEFNENPSWAGVKDNANVIGGNLQLEDTNADGYYYFDNSIDLGGVYTSFVSGTLVSGGAFVNNLFTVDDIFAMDDVFGTGQNDIFAMADIFAVQDIFGIGTDSWEIQLQVRFTSDDPTASPVTWTDWQELTPSFYEFWGAEFRILLRSLDENISPSVSSAYVIVDMPDRIERGDDLTVTATGATITYPFAFKNNPAVNITLQDGAVDDRIEFTSKNSSGFAFKVYNQTISGYVTRSFDYIASGYGRL